MNDLYKTVERARDEIQEHERQAAQRAGRKRKPLLGQGALLGLCALLLVALVYLVLGESIEAQVEEDLRDAAVDLLLDADDQVVRYYATNLVLPDQLPDPLARVQVNYQAVEGTRFSLQASYGPHQQVIQRDVLEPLERSDILEAFGE